MASPYEVEVKVYSAKNLKNVNWRNGPNRPYAVVWVDPSQKRSTDVDKSGDTQPNWDEKLIIPLLPSVPINDSILSIDVLHSEPNGEVLIIGSAQLPLDEFKTNDESSASRTLKLKRPSGRPQGTIDIKVNIKNTNYVPSYGVPLSYGVPPPTQQPYGTPYSAPYGTSVNVAYGNPYSTQPPAGYPVAAATPIAAPYGYSQSGQQGYGYGQSAPSVNVTVRPENNNVGGPQNYGYGQSGQQGSGYGQSAPTVNVTVGGGAASGQPNSGYGQSGQQGYGYGQSGTSVNVNVRETEQLEKKKSSKMRMGAGLLMGAVVGGIGALALEKGIDSLEDHIAERVYEKTEEEQYIEEYYDDDF